MRVWTPRVVRHCIYTRFGIESCRERVRQLRPARGWRVRRRRHRPLRATPEAPAACRAELQALRTTWPAEAERLCVDEATVRRHPTRTAPWGVVDDVPESPPGEDHRQGPISGAVAPLTGRSHDHLRSELGRREFAAFLRPLVSRSPERRRLVIHDRAGPPQGAPLETVGRDATGGLPLQAPPASCPALHPAERLWQWRRRVVTPKHWVDHRAKPIHASRAFGGDLAGLKAQGRQVCGFKTPESFIASL